MCIHNPDPCTCWLFFFYITNMYVLIIFAHNKNKRNLQMWWKLDWEKSHSLILFSYLWDWIRPSSLFSRIHRNKEEPSYQRTVPPQHTHKLAQSVSPPLLILTLLYPINVFSWLLWMKGSLHVYICKPLCPSQDTDHVIVHNPLVRFL